MRVILFRSTAPGGDLQATALTQVFGQSHAAERGDSDYIMYATHRKGARKSTEAKHQKGDARRGTDGGGERGDARRRNQGVNPNRFGNPKFRD
jgi:hypothetical protein